MSQPAIAQKQVTTLLLVVVLLLAAIVGVLIYRNMQPATPVAPTRMGAEITADPAAPAGMPPANMGGAASAPVEFDPSSAPIVPADMTPGEYVFSYYEACAKKDYEYAFTLLPAGTKQTYGDAASFASTLEGYGISDFTVEPQVEGDGVITVIGVQQAQGMGFGYEWTFVQGEDGSWLCQSRAMAGSQ